jgi:alkanesulfonate monooxygenase SsuD/methylene tetrahydromethanopterin reductase-like flavin-dependent oxidoreductase (luciferase family)
MSVNLAPEFHYSPIPGDESPPLGGFVDLCRAAEAAGYRSIHVPIFNCASESLRFAIAAGDATTAICLRVGWSFESLLASLRGAELARACQALPGRIAVHMRFTGAEPAHDGNYISAGELIGNLRACCDTAPAPPFDVEGDAAEAAFLAIKHASCLWRLPKRAKQAFADALPVLHFGKPTGLVTRVFARPTAEEAREAAATSFPEPLWVTPKLCTAHGAAALVGSYDEIAGDLGEYHRHGITRLLLRDRPAGTNEMARFAGEVMPRVLAGGRGSRQ